MWHFLSYIQNIPVLFTNYWKLTWQYHYVFIDIQQASSMTKLDFTHKTNVSIKVRVTIIFMIYIVVIITMLLSWSRYKDMRYKDIEEDYSFLVLFMRRRSIHFLKHKQPTEKCLIHEKKAKRHLMYSWKALKSNVRIKWAICKKCCKKNYVAKRMSHNKCIY